MSDAAESQLVHKGSFKELLGCLPAIKYNNEAFEAAFVDLMAMQDESFRLIEAAAFRKFVNLLPPGTRVPSASSIQRRIIAIFENKKKSLIAKLQQQEFVNFTTDIWTSPSSMSFMAMNGPFITSLDFEMYSLLLTLKKCLSLHTDQN